MREFASLLFIHFWLAAWACAIYNALWGKGIERSYEAWMKSPLRYFLLLGAWGDKEVWVKRQRIMMWFSIPFVGLIYIGVLASILKGHYMF
jgi:hypothetical protein